MQALFSLSFFKNCIIPYVHLRLVEFCYEGPKINSLNFSSVSLRLTHWDLALIEIFKFIDYAILWEFTLYALLNEYQLFDLSAHILYLMIMIVNLNHSYWHHVQRHELLILDLQQKLVNILCVLPSKPNPWSWQYSSNKCEILGRRTLIWVQCTQISRMISNLENLLAMSLP